MGSKISRFVTVALPMALLQGCFEEKLDEVVNRETYAFQALYENTYDDQILVFNHGVLTYKFGEQIIQREFYVKDSKVHIRLRNNSKEQRDDLIMVIHGDGEVLSCNSCAMHNLASMWQRQVQ